MGPSNCWSNNSTAEPIFIDFGRYKSLLRVNNKIIYSDWWLSGWQGHLPTALCVCTDELRKNVWYWELTLDGSCWIGFRRAIQLQTTPLTFEARLPYVTGTRHPPWWLHTGVGWIYKRWTCGLLTAVLNGQPLCTPPTHWFVHPETLTGAPFRITQRPTSLQPSSILAPQWHQHLCS